ncbi:ABC transporter ATP-binding protein [Noviherbaspirillum saxi]|uniref:ABC transporter ATP-binding protein n=1 Tax=Noviherbaspirillum saxi TaxID=2320863 RepID=A0A3A3FW71_9BURK|nr:ABC transporter ATP-binding protein [Noviherbaspirillum saxi]RJF99880.1 ABC transporter ATP-binding protein [Noviherbaspirillum saxi]
MNSLHSAAGAQADTPVLAIDKLCVGVRQADKSLRRVVDNATFSIKPGEIIALVGESGSGKTMIGRSVLQLLPQVARIESGSIRFQGQELLGANEARLRDIRGSDIGMVFQEPMVSLNPALTVGFQMMEALKLHHKLSDAEARQRCLAMLEKVRIVDPVGCFAAYPHQFSGGMRQRIMLASVLVLQPKLLIADEPTTALDAIIQKEVMDIMAALTREMSTAVLLVSHDLGMVAHYASRVVVMRHGRMVEEGATANILLAPQHEYTRMLLDSLPRRGEAVQRDAPGGTLIDVKSLAIEFRKPKTGFWQKPEVNRAVIDVDLKIDQGETVAVVGESGSGKTTIGRAIVRLVDTAGGSIEFLGRDITRIGRRQLIDYRLQTQMVFQDPFSSLDPRMTLEAIVAEGLRNVPDINRKECSRRARAMLEEVGLAGDYAQRFPHELSGGQRQRVCIARAIVANPKFLVADEPVSALDVTVQKQILTLLQRLQQKFGFTYLFISHDLGVVEQISDRVVVMYRGRILETGPRDAIYDDPRHPYTLRLLQATPRIARTADGAYQLALRNAKRQQAPQGYSYFNHGSIHDMPPSAGDPQMVEVGDRHFVACAPA